MSEQTFIQNRRSTYHDLIKKYRQSIECDSDNIGEISEQLKRRE